METIFKEGMEVYDQINFPNDVGIITEIVQCKPNQFIETPIKVKFKMGCNTYTLDGKNSTFSDYKVLSTKPYKVELVGFEQKAPIPTFEHALDWVISTIKDNYFIELDKQLKALNKLIILRDYYNDGWQPDWKNPDVIKHTLEVFANELKRSGNYTLQKLLVFKTKEIRDRFFEEQRELLEIAKPLL